MSLRETLTSRAFVTLMIAEAIRNMTFSAVVTHIMPYLSFSGLSRTRAGLVTAAIPLLSIIGRFGMGWLVDIFDKKKILVLAFCFLNLGLLAFCFVEVTWTLLPFLLLFSCGLGGGQVARVALLKECFRSGIFGRLLGIIMGASAMGGIIGPTLVGRILDTGGTYQVAWFVLLGMMGIAIALILSLDLKRISATEAA